MNIKVNEYNLPNTTYGGNPAKFIRKRFSDEQIEMLLKLQWWNWDDVKIK